MHNASNPARTVRLAVWRTYTLHSASRLASVGGFVVLSTPSDRGRSSGLAGDTSAHGQRSTRTASGSFDPGTEPPEAAARVDRWATATRGQSRRSALGSGPRPPRLAETAGAVGPPLRGHLHPSHRVALELPRHPPVQGHEQVAPEQPPWGSADGASRPGWRRAISSIAASRRTYSERWRSSRRRSATVMPAPALAAWPGPRRGRSARRSGSARTARRSGASRCSPSTPDRRAWRRPCRRTRGSRSAP